MNELKLTRAALDAAKEYIDSRHMGHDNFANEMRAKLKYEQKLSALEAFKAQQGDEGFSTKSLSDFIRHEQNQEGRSSEGWASSEGDQSPQACYRSGMTWAYQQVLRWIESNKQPDTVTISREFLESQLKAYESGYWPMEFYKDSINKLKAALNRKEEQQG